ncbi:MAG: DUF2147 domain-containing protein [Balneolaceae bacterium]|nr:MAG: DUF2147 domain-containing protein [Balneolaceae bacterium]
MYLMKLVPVLILLSANLFALHQDTVRTGWDLPVQPAIQFNDSEVETVATGVMQRDAEQIRNTSPEGKMNTTKPPLNDSDASLDVTGLWLSADKRGIIRIYEQDGKFYGRLVWLKEPEDDQGNTILDSKNPDPEKRDRPILGLQMVFGLEYSGGEWRNGEIYDPESGSTYSARLRLNGSDRMDLRGYIRLPMFGRTESWTRVGTLPDNGKIWPGFVKG